MAIETIQSLAERMRTAVKDLDPNMPAKDVLRYLRGVRINLRNLSNEVEKLEKAHNELRSALEAARAVQPMKEGA